MSLTSSSRCVLIMMLMFSFSFALARHPKLLLLDEPMANLDPVVKTVSYTHLVASKSYDDDMRLQPMLEILKNADYKTRVNNWAVEGYADDYDCLLYTSRCV